MTTYKGLAMKFYKNAKAWDKALCPNTCKTAIVADTKQVKNATVICVQNATYRNATISGVFALAEGQSLKLGETGKMKVSVYVRWFGHRIPTGLPTITFEAANAQILTGYDGDIVTNIEKT